MIRENYPRVLFCSNAYSPRFIGGAELIAEKYAGALRGMGYEAAVFAGDGQKVWGPHYSMQREDWNEVPVWRVQLDATDFANTGVNFVNRQVENRFEELLDAYRPTVVHCHNLIGLSVQLLHLAKRRGLRTGLTLHDHWMYCPRNTLMTPAGQLCSPRCACTCQSNLSVAGERELPILLRDGMMRTIVQDVDFFHFPSSYLHSVYLHWGLPPEKCRVIPYGIEIERFAKIQRRRDADRVRLTFAGYVGHHKGIELLVNAFIGTAEHPNLYLNVVGDGDLRKPLEARIREMKLADRVKFWKKIPNERMDEIYEQTDCLVLPSVWPENHPVSINEALACGIPVIGSDSGGIPEMVTHCKTGYLFQQGNQGELQQILAHVARNPDCLDVLSKNARKDVQRYSLRRTIHRVIELYDPQNTPSAGTGSGQIDSTRSVGGSPHADSHISRSVDPIRRPSRNGEQSSTGPDTTRRSVTVACIGDQFDQIAKSVVERLESGHFRFVVRVLLSDWIHDSQFDKVDLFWVLDGKSPIPSFVESRQDACLLIPEDHCQAAILTSSKQTSLYRDEKAAFAVIEALAIRATELPRVLARGSMGQGLARVLRVKHGQRRCGREES